MKPSAYYRGTGQKCYSVVVYGFDSLHIFFNNKHGYIYKYEYEYMCDMFTTDREDIPSLEFVILKWQ